MGYDLKRVDLDFEWPLKTAWEGYVNPFNALATACDTCDGRGYSALARGLFDRWYGKTSFSPRDRGSVPYAIDHPKIAAVAQANLDSSPHFYGTGPQALARESQRLAELFNGQWAHHLNQDDVQALIDADRLFEFTRTFVSGEGWKPNVPLVIPSAQAVNDWSLSGWGHDSINASTVVMAECARLGKSHLCDECGGECEHWPSQEIQQQAHGWERHEPPAGPGYQLWETITDGSPVSPVFERPDELAAWLSQHPEASGQKREFSQWMDFFAAGGWAPTLVCNSQGVMEGVDYTSS